MEAQTQLILRKVQHLQGTTSKSIQILAILIFVSFRTTAEPQQVADIGGITELSGNGQIVSREESKDATLKLGVKTNDEAITQNGRMAITFLDDSIVRLTEHSQLLIDEYIYDPDPSKSKMALTFAIGTTRFVSGSLNKIAKQNITLKTPTANIAIRGTDFSTVVDEIGRSLVILLPSADGSASGEIEVFTATGSVILNQPYQATTVSVFESPPSKPVILDLTLDLIDNYLIVVPPQEEKLVSEESTTKKSDILDFNDLDLDYLDSSDLLQDELKDFQELDIDYLADSTFLVDLLDILDELDVQQEEDALAEANLSGITLKGTNFGQDLDTGIITFITGEVLTLQREASASTARIDIDGNNSYTVILIQDGKSQTILVNGGSGSTITIKQSGG